MLAVEGCSEKGEQFVADTWAGGDGGCRVGRVGGAVLVHHGCAGFAGENHSCGHVPGAVSIPVAELRRRLKELPKNKEIVAYCRGPYCVFSDQAVELLRAKGFQAVRLDEGILDWRARGLHVAIGERP